MNRVRVTSTRRSRVYTIGTAWLLALLAGLASAAGPPTAPEISADPSMAKGVPAAPVTIVEFSDYQ